MTIATKEFVPAGNDAVCCNVTGMVMASNKKLRELDSKLLYVFTIKYKLI
jgi:hypothetical protein